MKARLQALGFDTYAKYLASAIWKDFKRRYRAAGQPCVCAVCGSEPVHLHHVNYHRLGREEFADVLPLCGDHHDQVHGCLRASGLAVNATQRAVERLRGGERFDTAALVASRHKRPSATGKRPRPASSRRRARAALAADPQFRALARQCLLLARQKGKRALILARQHVRRGDRQSVERMVARLLRAAEPRRRESKAERLKRRQETAALQADAAARVAAAMEAHRARGRGPDGA
jgi:hypothetical protein